MSLKIFSKIVVAMIVVVGLFGGGYIILISPTFRIEKVTIEPDSRDIHRYIFSKMKESLDMRLASLGGMPIWKVDLESVLKKVEADTRVKKAKITRRFPNKILVTILPHTPIASILGPRNKKLIPVSRDGELLPPLNPDEAMDLPILRGSIFLKEKDILVSAISLLIHLPEMGLLSQRSVSEITFDKKRGLKLLLTPTGVEVWMGTEDFPRRLSQAGRVIQYLEQEKMSGRIIDARFTKKVVVRLRNEP